jgi:tRNA(fMet)-specific endonuclease VapC
MHLLDTDTLSHLQAGDPNVITHLQQLDDFNVGTTIITRIELMRGRSEFLLKAATGEELLRAQRLYDRTEALLADLVIVPFDFDAVAQFDRLRNSST